MDYDNENRYSDYQDESGAEHDYNNPAGPDSRSDSDSGKSQLSSFGNVWDRVKDAVSDFFRQIKEGNTKKLISLLLVIAFIVIIIVIAATKAHKSDTKVVAEQSTDSYSEVQSLISPVTPSAEVGSAGVFTITSDSGLNLRYDVDGNTDTVVSVPKDAVVEVLYSETDSEGRTKGFIHYNDGTQEYKGWIVLKDADGTEYVTAGGNLEDTTESVSVSSIG